MCVCVLTCHPLQSEEDEYIDIEADDIDSMLNIFDEITAELLQEGQTMISTE